MNSQSESGAGQGDSGKAASGQAASGGLGPLFHLTRARLLEIVREPGILFWVFGFPVLMAVVLGLAFRTDAPKVVPIGVEGVGAAWVLEKLAGREDLSAEELTPEEAAEALRKGEIELVVEAHEPADGTSTGPQALRYRLDPTRPTSRAARLLTDAALQEAAGRKDAVMTAEKAVSEPGSRYIDFLIPGLIGLNLMGSSMWGIGFAIVMMRSQKLLRRFAVTPMRRRDFLFSIMLSRLVLLIVEMVFLVAVGWLAFGVAVRGSLWALLLVSVVGSASFTGLSLLVAARTKTIEVASGLMNVVMLPMWMMSGSFFAYTRFPEFLHPVLRVLPLTALNDALRVITNDGGGLLSIGPEMIVLVVWTSVSFAIALRIFRWQ